MIPGARLVGSLHEIHPYDLAEFLNAATQVEVHKTADIYKGQVVLKIGDDYYVQSIERPALTTRIK